MKTFIFVRAVVGVLARLLSVCLLTISFLLCQLTPLVAQTQKVKPAAPPTQGIPPANPTKVSGGKLSAVNSAGTLIISELRTSGPLGSADEFVELAAYVGIKTLKPRPCVHGCIGRKSDVQHGSRGDLVRGSVRGPVRHHERRPRCRCPSAECRAPCSARNGRRRPGVVSRCRWR